jgi:hypothetical protein
MVEKLESMDFTEDSPPDTVFFSGDMDTSADGSTHVESFRTLRATLEQLEGDDQTMPRVVIVFDEAQDLAKEIRLGRSQLSELRRALRKLQSEQLFSLFLSTTAHIFESTTSKTLDSSQRIQEGRLQPSPPFTELGFDVCAIPVKDGQHLLERYTDVAHMITLGRPL